MEKILQLDSDYIDKEQYPFGTEFTIEVNGTPPTDTKNDVRSLYFCPGIIAYRWIWIGNSSLELYSDVPRNAVNVLFYSLTQELVVLDFSDTHAPPNIIQRQGYDKYVAAVTNRNDYFVGCIFVYAGQASLIVSYNGNDHYARLNNRMNFSTSCFSCRTNVGYIVNPTYAYKNNMLVLESTKLLPQTKNELLLVKGLNKNLKIENPRLQQIYSIKEFTFQFRNVILDRDLCPCFDANDLFLVRPASTFKRNIVKVRPQKFRSKGILEFQIIEHGIGYMLGEELLIPGILENAVVKVVDINASGGILNLELIQPGNRFECSVYTLDNRGAKIRIISLYPYFEVNTENETSEPNYLLFFPEYSIWLDIEYFLVKRFYKSIVYFYANALTIISLNKPENYYRFIYEDQDTVLVEFIPYESVFPNVVVPLISYHQPVCYQIEIVSISLPNLPVCGVNLLLANFPYVLVTLTNSTNGSSENRGLLITNNPHATYSNFICPIANIRNPDIVKYVVVNSSQIMTFKFSPTDNLRFRVELPNGKLLRYNSTIKDNLQCDVTLPINRIYEGGVNVKKVYSIGNKLSVSAVFSLKLLT